MYICVMYAYALHGTAIIDCTNDSLLKQMFLSATHTAQYSLPTINQRNAKIIESCKKINVNYVDVYVCSIKVILQIAYGSLVCNGIAEISSSVKKSLPSQTHFQICMYVESTHVTGALVGCSWLALRCQWMRNWYTEIPAEQQCS